MQHENDYQAYLIKVIEERAPGVMCWPMDGNYRQGTPDILILAPDPMGRPHCGKWAFLEAKDDVNAVHQPNQDTYVEMLDWIGFARFIYPQNEQEVLYELFAFLGI